MKTEISALMDGELEDHEIRGTLDVLRRSEEARSGWNDAHLIGEALRGDSRLGFDVTARVMAALEQEPTVLAPQAAARQDRARPALALAASAAGVAVVAWLALAPAPEAELPARVAAVTARAVPVPATVASTPRLQEYLVAHQAYSSAGPMAGGARNIRTVSAAGEGR